MAFTLDNLRSLVGVVFVFGLAWALSSNRKQFPWRIAAIALGLEIVIAAAMLIVPPLRATLGGVSAALGGLQAAT